jgi:hypothetical protein
MSNPLTPSTPLPRGILVALMTWALVGSTLALSLAGYLDGCIIPIYPLAYHLSQLIISITVLGVCPGVSIGYIGVVLVRHLQRRPKLRLNSLVLFLVALPLLIAAPFCFPFTPVRLASPLDTLADLQHGPLHGHGIIEKTEDREVHGSRFNLPELYISIQGVDYYVPDGGWFHTLAAGQEIDFLYTEVTKTAFPYRK